MIIDLCFPSKIFSFLAIFSWDDCKAQDKLETMLMQNFGRKTNNIMVFLN